MQASKLRSDRVTHQLVKSVATNVAKKVHNQIIYNREIYCQTILLGWSRQLFDFAIKLEQYDGEKRYKPMQEKNLKFLS